MIISTCPRCREGFRVPTGPIPEDAYAHCPWCRETFPISEVLDNLPPQLEIVSSDGTPLVIGEKAALGGSGLQLVEPPRHQPFPVAAETVIDDEIDESYQLHEPEDDPYETWDSTDSSSVQSMNVSTRSGGSKKRKGGGLGTFIGIVLGGLASVPIAGGLLMLLGRTPDWGFWPFQAEQTSQAYSSMRAAPLPSSEPNLTSSPSTGTTLRFGKDQPSSPPQDDPAELAASEILGSSPTEAPKQEAPEASTSTQDTQVASVRGPDPEADRLSGTAEMMPGPSSGTTNSVTTNSGTTNSGTTNSGTTNSGSSDEVASSIAPPATESTSPKLPPNTPSAIAAPPVETVSDASKLATEALQMIDAMRQFKGNDDERARRLSLTYQKIAIAAEKTQQPTELFDLAGKIVDSPFRDVIKSAGWKWLVFKNRTTDGIALIGRIQASGEPYLLTSDSGKTVTLVAEEPIPSDQEVLVLGRLIDQGETLSVVLVEPIP